MTMIECKSPRQVERMREAGKIVAGALRLARELAKEGVTTGYLDKELDRYVQQHNGRAMFKGYRGFPSSICTSINEEVVHGIPGPMKLRTLFREWTTSNGKIMLVPLTISTSVVSVQTRCGILE